MIVSPNFKGRRNKLGAVVHTQKMRISVLTSGLLQCANDLRARIRKLGLHRQRVSTAFVEQRQRAEDTIVQQAIGKEVQVQMSFGRLERRSGTSRTYLARLLRRRFEICRFPRR